MPIIPIPIINGDRIANGPETDYRDALPVNFYAVKKDILNAPGYMMSYPGLSLFGTGQGADRGGIYNERFNMHFRVSGTSLISVSSTGAVTVLGTIPGTSQVALPYSFNTQGIIADGKFFLYDPAGGFRQVTDADVGSPLDCAWIDGYYFLTDGDYVYHTEIGDEESIDPLSYATAEFMPDDSIGVSKTQDNKINVFGRYSLEPFVDVATAQFAFQRVESRSQKIGIVATHAKVESGGKFYMVGSRKDESVSVYILGVGAAEKVATREIEKLISAYTESELSDIRVEARMENDVSFILVHLPNETLCFNESAAMAFGKETAWSILKSDVNGNTPYRAINGVYDPRISRWVYGDKLGPNIGLLDNDISTHYGDIVEGILYTPLVNLETMSINGMELDTIAGHNAVDDAKAAFSMTINGVSYGREYWMNYGGPLEYGKRFIANRLGYIPKWAGFKLRTASRSRMAFSLMRLDYA